MTKITVDELIPIIAAATVSHRHVHAAYTNCAGCTEKAAKAVVRYIAAVEASA